MSRTWLEATCPACAAANWACGDDVGAFQCWSCAGRFLTELGLQAEAMLGDAHVKVVHGRAHPADPDPGRAAPWRCEPGP